MASVAGAGAGADVEGEDRAAQAGNSVSGAVPTTIDETAPPDEVLLWTVNDVCQWVGDEDFGPGLGQYSSVFKAHQIDGETLVELEASDLVSSMGISITGHVKRLLRFIKRLQGARQLAAVWAAAAAATASTPSAAAAAAQGFSPTHAPAAIATDLPALDAVSSAPSGDWVPRTPQVGRRGASRGAAAAASVEASALQALGTNGAAMDLPGPRMFRTMSGGFMNLPPSASLVALKPPPRELPEWSIGDISRAVLSFFYFLFAIFCTSMTMVVVHERVPDPAAYPPLPDLFLDNIPVVPNAFAFTEWLGLCLFMAFTAILVLHKHRLIVLRRAFSISGSIFLLRCLTMVVTSLSVPGKHLECKAMSFGETWEEKLGRAWEIGSKFGMTTAGVKTCGDYMFSGHTVAVTLLNFLVTEYTPKHWKGVHITTWVLNVFAMFFILAAHEHYSVDVLIAFYISTRLFLYYHSMANLNALHGADRERTQSWYPMFSYLEEEAVSSVPNVLGSPWRQIFDFVHAKLHPQPKARLRTGAAEHGRQRNSLERSAASVRGRGLRRRPGEHRKSIS